MKAPYLLRKMYPSLLWKIPGRENRIFLTFDDGPIPEVTPWVLDTLDEFNARATFFCIGENVSRHPHIYEDILRRGHRTGNHTQKHLNGWKVKNKQYFEDIAACSGYVDSELFRPPYGKIKPSQIRHLKKKYQLVMWDVLSMDFDMNRIPSQCTNAVIREAGPGSIIVFHDSLKAAPRLKVSLPAVLKYFQEKNYRFDLIEDYQRLRK
jgi:peptidoglycan/xylan/chitin deacetylase (PgdA/CDA1 family)